MRIGLLGGTFDPIHHGHLDVARAAHGALALDAVWVVPARQPPHRTDPYASAAHRFAMAALAVDGDERLVLSDLEMDVAGPSYTTGTLDRLSASGVPLTSVFVILGADAFRDVHSWKGYPGILDRCHFAVVARPGLPAAEAVRAVRVAADRLTTGAPTSARPSVVAIEAVTRPFSSTDVRRAVAAGEPIDAAVPPAVRRYIAVHGLYQPSKALDNDPQGAA